MPSEPSLQIYVNDIPLQDDMIEGEMFKQLGVKEEDKESDEEAGRFVALALWLVWSKVNLLQALSFRFSTRRTLENGPSTPDLARSSRFFPPNSTQTG